MANNINKLKVTLSKSNNFLSKTKLNGDVGTLNKMESSKLKDNTIYRDDSDLSKEGDKDESPVNAEDMTRKNNLFCLFIY